jgi:uncharacterized protein YndB with AHSA1/START domain
VQEELMSEPEKVAGVSSEAVAAKTGKTWVEWFGILDAAGAKQMKHPDIARLLQEKHGVPDWWCQMVTVGYEQARGLRAVNESTDGFAANASKTVKAPIERLFATWADETQRDQWLLAPGLQVRRATTNKSMRITWADGSNVDVGFYSKGEAKSQVTVQHSRLPDADAVAAMRELWRTALGKLQVLLEN